MTCDFGARLTGEMTFKDELPIVAVVQGTPLTKTLEGGTSGPMAGITVPLAYTGSKRIVICDEFMFNLHDSEREN